MTGFTWTLPDFIQTIMPTDQVFYANGCSLVFGAELGGPDKDGFGWASDISNEFNFYRIDNAYPGIFRSEHFPSHRYFNAAKPGSSNDRILRTSMDDILTLLDFGIKPENLFVLVGWTNGMRFEIYERDHENYSDIIPGAPYVGSDFQRQIADLKMTKIDDASSLARKTNHQIISLQSFLKTQGIDYLFCSSLDIYPRFGKSFMPKTLVSFGHIDRDKYACTEKPMKRDELADSFTTVCGQTGVPFGSGHHPLEEGHKLWAQKLSEFYKTHAKA